MKKTAASAAIALTLFAGIAFLSSSQAQRAFRETISFLTAGNLYVADSASAPYIDLRDGDYRVRIQASGGLTENHEVVLGDFDMLTTITIASGLQELIDLTGGVLDYADGADATVDELRATSATLGTAKINAVPVLPVQTPSTFFAGPVGTPAAAPAFRTIVAADIPDAAIDGRTIEDATLEDATITGTLARADQTVIIPALLAVVPTGGAWTVGPSASAPVAVLGADNTTETLTIPILGLKPDFEITALTLRGLSVSEGATNTLELALMKFDADGEAEVEAFDPVVSTEGEAINALMELTAPEAVAAGSIYSLLVTGYTGSSCTIAIISVEATLDEI